MISDITFNDFRFFKGEKSFSFVADARTKKLLSNSVSIGQRAILKAAAIYGPNNSGKSNIIALFAIFKSVLAGKPVNGINNPIFGDSPTPSFSITFNNLDGNGWMSYSFGFDTKDGRFIKEELKKITYYENGSPFEEVIFSIDTKEKVYLIYGKDEKEALSLFSFRNTLLYSIETGKGRFESLAKYQKALKRLSDSISIVKLFNTPLENTISALKSGNERKKKFILAFVKDADLSVNDFEYSKSPLVRVNLENGAIDEKALSDYSQAIDSLHLVTTYGNKKVPSMFFDSYGTKKMEAIASYIYDAISEGKTLIVDELDNGLHYRLTRAIVSAFNNLANEKGQIVFTAHDLMLVDAKNLLRKDQIFFLSRNNEGGDIFCLKKATTASGGPREGSDLLKRYNHGDFGSLPSPDFISEVIGLQEEGDKNDK